MDDYDSADIDADDEGENSFLPFEFCASFSLGLSHNWRSLPMAQNNPKRLSDATVKIDQDSQALTGSVLPEVCPCLCHRMVLCLPACLRLWPGQGWDPVLHDASMTQANQARLVKNRDSGKEWKRKTKVKDLRWFCPHTLPYIAIHLHVESVWMYLNYL